MTADGDPVWLVLLEAVGKQAFIFETNRLRQNLGASQMVSESTTRVLAAVLPDEVATWDDSAQQVVLGDGRIDAGADVEVVVATSGKAMVLCADRVRAEDLVFGVTSRCLWDLPGVRVVGVIEQLTWGSGMNDASRRAHRRLDQVAAETASPRFLRLPIVEDCSLSGHAAARRIRTVQEDKLEALSLPSIAKEHARQRALDRLGGLGDQVERDSSALENPPGSWLAVVHADGNGLGAVFSDFGAALEKQGLPADDRSWVDQFRSLSQAVEEVTVAAFEDACGPVDGSGDPPPVVPIVLGGDDMTAVTLGRSGWELTIGYLNAFAARAADHEVVQSILSDPLTASAGIAFVKHHFPFSSAYGLAEELASSAKSLKPDPGLDFHVLYDSSSEGLPRLRASVGGRAGWRSAGPFMLAPAGGQSASDVAKVAAALGERDDDGVPMVPRSQIQRVREACGRSEHAAEVEWKRVRDRSHPLRGVSTPDLFATGGGTVLFDAVALADVQGVV